MAVVGEVKAKVSVTKAAVVPEKVKAAVPKTGE